MLMSTNDSGQTESRHLWQFGRFSLNESTFEFRIDGYLTPLPTKPFLCLAALLRHAGQTVTRDELIEAAWDGRATTDAVVAQVIKRVRQALGDGDHQLVKTVHGVGFRFAAPVRVGTVEPLQQELGLQISKDTVLRSRPHWRFERSLNIGGRSAVWLARHSQTHERRVFKLAFDPRGLRALKRELSVWRLFKGQAKVPVPKVLDYDFSERPFLMEVEYISGLSMIEWLESQSGVAALALELRLELVAQCADLLAQAHAVGAIHGDLKPQNLLVDERASAAGGTSPPQLLLADFGSAQLTTCERLNALEVSAITLSEPTPGGTGGTYTYLAPEVVAGESISARSDAFALGVLMFQMVIGDLRRALAPGWERAVSDSMLRQEISTLADIDPAHRTVDFAELARRLRTLEVRRQALQREQELSRRLENARRAAVRNRRRWRWAGLAASGLLAALSVAWWQYLEADAARLAASQRAMALDATQRFLFDEVLAANIPLDYRRSDTTLAEILDRAALRAPKAHADDPSVRAMIWLSLARANLAIGRAALVQQQLDAARESEAASLRANAYARARIDLLQLALDSASARTSSVPAAREAELARTLGESSDEGLRLASLLAEQRALHGDLAGSLTASERVLQQAIRARGNQDALIVLELRNDLVERLLVQGQLERADRALSEFQGDLEQAPPGLDELQWLRARTSIAELAAYRNDFARAVVLQSTTVARMSTLQGPDHPITIEAEGELGQYQWLNGDKDGGLARLKALAERAEARLGLESLQATLVLHNYSTYLINSGNYALASQISNKLRAKVMHQSAHWVSVGILRNAGVIAWKLGQLEAARAYFDQAIDRAKALQPNSREQLLAEFAFAQFLEDTGRHDESDQIYQRLRNESAKRKFREIEAMVKVKHSSK